MLVQLKAEKVHERTVIAGRVEELTYKDVSLADKVKMTRELPLQEIRLARNRRNVTTLNRVSVRVYACD